jgi:hypothetical protein
MPIIAACGMVYTPPRPTSVMLDVSVSQAAELDRGYLLHQQNCAKCHAFENPAKYTPEDLAQRIMPMMARKAKLSPVDEQAVLKYLLAARKIGS